MEQSFLTEESSPSLQHAVNIVSDELQECGNNLLRANQVDAEYGMSDWRVSDSLKRYERFAGDCQSQIFDEMKVLRRFNMDLTKLDGEIVRKAFDLAALCCLSSLEVPASTKNPPGRKEIEDFGITTTEEHGHLVEELLAIADSKTSAKVVATWTKPVATAPEKDKTISSVPAPPLKAKLTGDKRLNFSKALICQTTAIICAELLDSDLHTTTLPYSDIETEKVLEQASLLSRRILGSVKRWWKSKRSRNLLKEVGFRQYQKNSRKTLSEKIIPVVHNPFMKSWKPSQPLNIEDTRQVSPSSSIVGISDDVEMKIETLLSTGNNIIYVDPEDRSWNERMNKLTNILSSKTGMILLITSSLDIEGWITSLKKNCLDFLCVSSANDLRPQVSSRVIIVAWHILMENKVHEAVAAAGTYELVIGDYGVDMMGVHASDPNSIIGRFFETLFIESLIDTKEGIVASQKIFTAKKLATEKSEIPSAALLAYFFPELMDGIKEEWDRCKFSIDSQGHAWVQDCVKNGIISNSDTPVSLRSSQKLISSVDIPNASLFTASRMKSALQWISEELAHDFNYLPHSVGDNLAISSSFICCEVVPGSNYCASLCGRKFANEANLRQHKTAMHAPRGTWLCRTCGGDCITSSARTQHERYCGEYHMENSSITTTGAKQHGPGVGKRGNISTKTKTANQPDLISGGTSSVVPALSVINIKDLPSHIKPLLRDPRQTSRTGGGSKKNKERYIYLYRGVCRQARKGHDRWQSQISFGGTNHYLGTFDSEWDAAAVYAWAHWILYGKEATLKAQKEGEEAAAAWEREKILRSEGKLPSQSPLKDDDSTATQSHNKATPEPKLDKRLDVELNTPMKTIPTASGRGAKRIISNLAVFKASALHTSDESNNISALLSKASERLSILHKRQRTATFYSKGNFYSKCQPVDKETLQSKVSGIALFFGIRAVDFDWKFNHSDRIDLKNMITAEYGPNGYNEQFASILRSNECVFGLPSKEYLENGTNINLSMEIGGSIGDVDCAVGGPENSCSPCAARLTRTGDFHIAPLNEEDTVSLNGTKLSFHSSPKIIRHGDVISIGPRVFVFILDQ